MCCGVPIAPSKTKSFGDSQYQIVILKYAPAARLMQTRVEAALAHLSAGPAMRRKAKGDTDEGKKDDNDLAVDNQRAREQRTE